MICLGLDPGTSDNMALAALLPDGYADPLRVLLVEPGKAKEARDRAAGVYRSLREKFERLDLPPQEAVLAVEWQRSLRGDKRPDNIIDLNAFVGLGIATVQSICGAAVDVLVPYPEEWKGQVDKHVKQNRIVAAAGLGLVRRALERADIRVPPNLGAFEKEFTGMASDVIDAIGLAQWAREKARLRALVKRATLPRS